MAMVGVASGSLQADSQPGSFGLVWGSAAAWRRSTFIIWTGWTLAVALSYNDSTINIVIVVVVIIIIIIIIIIPKRLHTWNNSTCRLWSQCETVNNSPSSIPDIRRPQQLTSTKRAPVPNSMQLSCISQIKPWLQLRFACDTTTTYRARLLPFDAIRREKK